MNLLSPRSVNIFLLFKLPAAFLCGVRMANASKKNCTVTVKHRWINQNPFNSLYFAVQAMAAELSTGVLVMHYVKESNQKLSMLVTENKAIFSKKATGKVTFICTDGEAVLEKVKLAIDSREGQQIWLKSIGKNEQYETVAEMDFCWSIKIK